MLRGHPNGLASLFFTEMWERFSYYGMRALLTLFLVAAPTAGGLGLTTAQAAVIYGNYTMAVYMLSIPGGFVADSFLGARRAVLFGGMIIALGHFMLAVPMLATFYTGLVCIVVGTGLFKPNISALVGGLYGPADERRDGGFALFYMGINVGGFFAPLVTGFLAQSAAMKSWLSGMGLDPNMSWHWGFGAAGVGMCIALLHFVVQGRNLSAAQGAVDESPALPIRGWTVLLGTGFLLALTFLSDRPGFEWLRILFLALPAAAVFWLAVSGDVDRRRLAAAFVFFIAAMIFFAIFEQAGVTIALFADQLMRAEIAGIAFPSAWVQSLNSFFVITLAPIFAWLWTTLGPRQPSSPVKFALGLGFLAASYLLMVPAAVLTIEGKVSPLWIVGLFFLQTVGELCLSPVGLSTMTKLAPARMVGLVLGIWFLAAAWGNKLAGILGGEFSAADGAALAHYFLWQAGLVFAATLALILITPWVKRLMGGVR